MGYKLVMCYKPNNMKFVKLKKMKLEIIDLLPLGFSSESLAEVPQKFLVQLLLRIDDF